MLFVGLAGVISATELAAGAGVSVVSDGLLEHSDWWKFLARFHSALLHFPIGFIALTFLIELFSIFRTSPERARLVTFILVVSSISSAVVAAMGSMLSTEGGYDDAAVYWHKWLGFGVVAFAFVTTAAQLWARRRAPQLRPRLIYLALLSLTVLLVMITGHHGGNLTHGSEYLVKYAPRFVKNMVTAVEPSLNESVAVVPDGYFGKRIQPILLRKCVACHGPEKQKGNYRVDERSILLRGGESGQAAIVAGEPLKSNLLRLVLLSPDDDDVMPPKGKEPLSGDEVIELVRWIKKGAHFDDQEIPTAASELPAAASVPPPPHGPEALVAAVARSRGEPAPASSKPEAEDKVPVDFAKEIKPLLEAKCMECHSSEKHKGKFEIQTREAAVRGGKKNGAGMTAGNPGASSIYTRITAALDDDDVMPPTEDGGPLSSHEIDVVKRWIQDGAPWPDGIALTPKPKAD